MGIDVELIMVFFVVRCGRRFFVFWLGVYIFYGFYFLFYLVIGVVFRRFVIMCKILVFGFGVGIVFFFVYT